MINCDEIPPPPPPRLDPKLLSYIVGIIDDFQNKVYSTLRWNGIIRLRHRSCTNWIATEGEFFRIRISQYVFFWQTRPTFFLLQLTYSQQFACTWSGSQSLTVLISLIWILTKIIYNIWVGRYVYLNVIILFSNCTGNYGEYSNHSYWSVRLKAGLSC